MFLVNQRSLVFRLLPNTFTLSTNTGSQLNFGRRRLTINLTLSATISSGDIPTTNQNPNTTQWITIQLPHPEENDQRRNSLSPFESQATLSESTTTQPSVQTIVTEAQIQWDLTEGPQTWSGLQQQQRLPPVAEFYTSEGPDRGRRIAREATTQEEAEIRKVQREEEDNYQRIEAHIDELLYKDFVTSGPLVVEYDLDSEEERQWTREYWADQENNDRDHLPDEVDSDFWESHSARSA